MIYIITNVNLIYNFDHNEVCTIFYNPWGFSRSSIKNEFLKTIESFNIKKDDQIIMIMKPLFFGKRVKIVETILFAHFKNVKILNCLTSQQSICLDEIA
jgi:hypothetical protein